jgi:hypothetical protein
MVGPDLHPVPKSAGLSDSATPGKRASSRGGHPRSDCKNWHCSPIQRRDAQRPIQGENIRSPERADVKNMMLCLHLAYTPTLGHKIIIQSSWQEYSQYEYKISSLLFCYGKVFKVVAQLIS